MRRAAAALWLAAALPSFAADWVHAGAQRGDFPLATRAASAAIVYDAADARVVGLAARDLAADMERVTGRKPAVANEARGPAVLVGTLGKSALIDALAKSGKLDAARLRGAWESFIITTVEAPLPGVPRALVIAGSDPRGTAYGVYELSEAIGVSPWYWWADVPVARRDALYVGAGTRRFGPPSVKYRGIFINDEDWGLQPWAAKTFEPENGGIGPRTYGRMFELLLRLKANTVWPAMHPGTPPFNADPRNAALADEYAIVMGSSHAEPMLRNNVGEWKAPHEDYNYVSNADGVRRYWEERMQSNGRYENIYTLGMRGIHDSSMQGAKTDAERVALLQKIFADQRGLLAKYALPEAPQMFCAYKEVLPLYRQGLQVPDDVTIVWPDDNFGYIRNFSGAAERARSGGAGVYYHLSYLGAPLSYLWLYTTPPALVWAEMSRAYASGADRIWIANVGDLKPAEIGTEFFLRLAWDAGRWGSDAQLAFLRQWAGREFGPALAGDVAGIMGEYYRLNFSRRPEHLQWWLPKKARRPSDLSAAEVETRLAEFASLRRRVEAVRARLPSAAADAFFELVEYPVLVSALANERFFEGERGRVDAALAADAALTQLTARWDGALAGGKWRHIMSAEPADGQWRSMRIAKWTPPASDFERGAGSSSGLAARGGMRIEAEAFQRQFAGAGSRWERVPGLGRTGDGAVAILGSAASARNAGARAAGADGDEGKGNGQDAGGKGESAGEAGAARLDYDVELAAGEYAVRVHMLPTFPSAGGGQMRLAVALNGEAPQAVTVDVPDGGAAWAQGVLNNDRVASTTLRVAASGRHTLRLYGADVGLVVDSMEIVPLGR
ncbi:glycosyl hydrolase 115 family protein [Pseudoduganella sp. UC29_106]|uniref:glycosyl hydrolase 115 family protein n=1 Tax=Pseudoduganella sp. UC29_106 TaxID=3374553 RepID=UPI003756369C